MMHKPNRKKSVEKAISIVKENQEEEFIISIVERLEKYSKELQEVGPTNDVKKKLMELESDIFVYSRIMPIKLQETYPDRSLKSIARSLENYGDLMKLFIDTYKYCVTGDPILLPPALRK